MQANKSRYKAQSTRHDDVPPFSKLPKCIWRNWRKLFFKIQLPVKLAYSMAKDSRWHGQSSCACVLHLANRSAVHSLLLAKWNPRTYILMHYYSPPLSEVKKSFKSSLEYTHWVDASHGSIGTHLLESKLLYMLPFTKFALSFDSHPLIVLMASKNWRTLVSMDNRAFTLP